MIMKGFEFPGSSNIKNDKKANTSSNITPNVDLKQDEENGSITKADIINANPYEETVVNTNPYTNVNISDVISETEVDEETVVNDSPESTQNQKRELTDDEITEIEIEKIKAERRRKIKGFRLVYVVFMAIILVILAVCYNQTRKNAKPIVIGDIEINTKDDNPPIEQLEISAELNNFYQSKFDYFRVVSGYSAILIGLLEMTYFISDCILYGSLFKFDFSTTDCIELE